MRQPLSLARDREAKELRAGAFAPLPAGDAHAFDLRPPHALPAETRQKAELQRPDDLAVELGDEQFMVGIGSDGFEGLVVRIRQRRLVPFALRAEHVVGEQGHDARHVLFPGAAEYHVMGSPPPEGRAREAG